MRAVVAVAPLGRDLDPLRRVSVQPPPGRGPVECLQEVLAGEFAEFCEYLFGRIEFDRQVMEPRLPRTGGATAEVRRHVLDDQGRDQLRALGGQTPGVQAAHRMPD